MNDTTSTLVAPAIAFASAWIGWGTPVALFAESAEYSHAVIEEVVVTARKREESAQEVPVAITALSGELRSSNIRNLVDVNGYAPNVNIDNSLGRTGASAITIRGISPTRTDDNSFDSPIGVMIDGIYLGSQAGQIIENFDLERIEILRGPQGTLFGKNTVGGVVNVIRSRPTGELGARLKYTIGKWGQREMRAVINAPIVEHRLDAKVFYSSIEEDGFLYNTNLQEDFPSKDYSNYGITVLATPNDRFEALFTAEKFNDDSDIRSPTHGYNVPPGLIPPPADPRSPSFARGFLACILRIAECRTDLTLDDTTTMDFNGPASLDVEAYTLNMEFDLNDQFRAVSVTGYRDMVEDRLADFDGAKGNFVTIERDNDYEQFSQELRLEFVNDRLSAIAGGYYWRSEFAQDWINGGRIWSVLAAPVLGNPRTIAACQRGFTAPIHCDSGIPPTHPGWRTQEIIQLLYSEQVTKSVALFAHADYDLLEKLTATVGVRWTREKKDFLGAQSYLTMRERIDAHNHPGFADLGETWKEISPKLGLSYRISEDVMLYGSYSEGFHSGGFFGAHQNTYEFERDQYDPEYANSWEAGLKGQFLDNRMQLNAAYFYNDFKDKQEQAVQFEPRSQTVTSVFSNVANAVYQGAELSLRFVINAYVNVFASYGYLDAEYRDFETDLNPNDDTAGQKIEDASHLRPRNAPKHTYGFGGSASIPVGDGEIEIDAKYNYVGAIETSLVNAENLRLASRDNLSASASYRWRRMSLTLFGRNLGDEVYEIRRSIANLTAYGTRVPGRSWGLELAAEL